MRVIEHEMLDALASSTNWRKDNTEVINGRVLLHGNEIAKYIDGVLAMNVATWERWDTNTTRSRLIALGFPVYRKNRRAMVNGILATELLELGIAYYAN